MALLRESNVIEDRQQVIAVGVEQEVRGLSYDGGRMTFEIDNELSADTSASFLSGFPDDRRGDRVNELGAKNVLSMAEYKGQIKDLRANAGAKGVDSKDRDAAKGFVWAKLSDKENR